MAGKHIEKIRTRQTAASLPTERLEIAAADDPSPATPIRPLSLRVELEHDECR
jgi:hypothetical protein